MNTRYNGRECLQLVGRLLVWLNIFLDGQCNGTGTDRAETSQTGHELDTILEALGATMYWNVLAILALNYDHAFNVIEALGISASFHEPSN